MDLALLEREADFKWRIQPVGRMRVPGVIFGSEQPAARDGCQGV